MGNPKTKSRRKQHSIPAFIGIGGLTAGVGGFLFRETRLWKMILLIICALFLIKPGPLTDLIGFASLAVVILAQKKTVDPKGNEKK
jgi:TRAP-type uncharacterized transport system fused permease subunit